MIDASVIIMTKNEALHIQRAVRSASRFEQVLVVDSASSDGTAQIAREAGAEVVDFVWNGAYPKKKEWALSVVRHQWVVYLDADEFLTSDLVDELERSIKNPDVAAVDVPVRYFWLGKELRFGHRVQKRIAFDTERGYWPRPDDLDVKNMWEVEGHYQPVITSGAVSRSSSRLGHDDKDGLFDYFSRHNRYSDWESHMLEQSDSASLRSRSRLGRLAANLPFKPTIFFVYAYVVRAGFLDGMSGFEYARALSYYYWQINLKRREIRMMTAKSRQRRSPARTPTSN